MKAWACHAAAYPNLFVAAFVDLKGYMEALRTEKREPLAMRHTAEDIRAMLGKVPGTAFSFTDGGDGMAGLAAFLRQDGLELYGHGRENRILLSALLKMEGRKDATEALHGISMRLAKGMKEDVPPAPFHYADMAAALGLDKAGKGVMQAAMNMQWHDISVFTFPPLTEEDAVLYHGDYPGMTAAQLAAVMGGDDRRVLGRWLAPVTDSCRNKAFVTAEAVRLGIDGVRLRSALSRSCGADLASCTWSRAADILFGRLYVKASGNRAWRGRKTGHGGLPLGEAVFPFIRFATPGLRALLEEMKGVTLESLGKKALAAALSPSLPHLKADKDGAFFEAAIGNMSYAVTTGGLHSRGVPGVLEGKVEFRDDATADMPLWDKMADGSFLYVSFDCDSYYPSIMARHGIAPAHLDGEAFGKALGKLLSMCLAAKRGELHVPGVDGKACHKALKAVVNAVVGKTGFPSSDTYDSMAFLKVTLNGQLMMLMLCEALEEAGIGVVAANTDGIVARVAKERKADFDRITSEWLSLTGMEATVKEYMRYVALNVNACIMEDMEGRACCKGAFDPSSSYNNLAKGYNAPIVAEAVKEYFLHGKPVLRTLKECGNILMFCKAVNAGPRCRILYTGPEGRKELPGDTRYYVSLDGGVLEKEDRETGARLAVCPGQKAAVLDVLDDTPMTLRGIRYGYYHDEAMKVIEPVRLGIPPGQALKRYARNYTLDFK